MTPTYEPVYDEQDPAKKQEDWDVAFGLQKVDGLEPSAYMRSLAKEHIVGQKSYAEIASALNSYYHNTDKLESRTEEADRVSEKIYQILAEPAFRLDYLSLKYYHKRLFADLEYDIFRPGEFRTVNLTKKEPILGGATVEYQDFGLIEESLKYDFAEESEQKYVDMPEADLVARLAEFTSRIWQVHPFMEGNTRTTAVFIEKYLLNLGFQIDNEPFQKDALYFRDALVLANYNNYQTGIVADRSYLESFFRKLLFKGELRKLPRPEKSQENS